MKQEVTAVATAAFLHDIGKFIERIAKDLHSNLPGTFPKEKYQPNVNGMLKYVHASYTALFIKDYLKKIPGIDNMDAFADLAAKHHLKELQGNERIIRLADRISSGMDQRSLDDSAEEIPYDDLIKTRMVSIFEELGENLTEYKNRRYQYDIAALSAQSIFPQSATDSPCAYGAVASGFEKDVKAICADNLSQWFMAFDAVCKKWISFIPSATVKTTLPDISLYDHLRTTSAIAQALYCYHEQTGTAPKENDEEDNTVKKFLYFKAKFDGIQNFIFSAGGAANKNAAKLLRGRSFYVSLLMKRATDLLCEQLGLCHSAVVMNAAGNITALLPNTENCKEVLAQVKQQINDWLFEQFYGEVSVSFAYGEITTYELTHALPEVGHELAKRLDEAKFTKFPLEKLGVIPDYFEAGQTPCPFCGKRPGKDEQPCLICEDLINIGQNICQKNPVTLQVSIFNKYNQLVRQDYDDLYIPRDTSGQTKTFNDIAAAQERGVSALGVLKADVDNLGSLFREISHAGGLSKQVTMSRLLDAFWTLWLPKKLEKDYPNIYTVFSGGDDLFLIGNWNEIISCALELKDKFSQFACHMENKIHFSAGIAFLKAGEPISTFYEFSEEALEKSKNYNGKNAFTLFGETISWSKKNDLVACYNDIEQLIAAQKLNSGALYKLMSFIDMAKTIDRLADNRYDKVTYADMQAFKWKALLAYFIARNDKFKQDASLQPRISEFIKQIDDKNQRSILKTMLWRNIYQNRERRK